MSNTDKKSGYLVCQGAIVECSFATVPMTQLSTVHGKSIFINDTNGVSQVVATTSEANPLALNFKSCARSNPSVPCTSDLTWSDTYPNVELEDGSKVLLHNSTAKCSYCPAAEIKILHHGQSTTPNAMHLDGMSVDISAINPVIGPTFGEERARNYNGTASVSSIKATIDGKEYVGGNKVDVYVKNHKLSFTAVNGSKSNPDLICWIIKKDGEKFHEFKKWGLDLKDVTFKKTGTYTVEAYGIQSGDSKCTITVNVEANSIKEIELSFLDTVKKISVGTDNPVIPIPKGVPLTIKANYKFADKNSLEPQVNWFVRSQQGGQEAIDNNRYNGTTLADSLLLTNCRTSKDESSSSMFVQINSYGIYSLMLKQNNMFFVNEIIADVRVEVVPETPEALIFDDNKTLYRPGENVTVELKTVGGNNSGYFTYTGSGQQEGGISWELQKYDGGTKTWKDHYEISFQDKLDTNKCLRKIPGDGKHIVSFSVNTKGKYRISVKTRGDWSIFKFNTRTELDSQQFTVADNAPVSNSKVSGGVKVGADCMAFMNEKIHFKVGDYTMPVKEEERAYIKWAIFDKKENDREEKIITKLSGTGEKEFFEDRPDAGELISVESCSQGDELIISFPKEGVYYVQPFRNTTDNIPGSNTIKVIVKGEAKIDDALWAYTTGAKATKAGVEQEVVCHMKSKSLAERSFDVKVWAHILPNSLLGDGEFDVNDCVLLYTGSNRFSSDGILNMRFTFRESDYNNARSSSYEPLNPAEEWNIPLFFTLTLDSFDSITSENDAVSIDVFEMPEEGTQCYAANNKITITNKPEVLYFYFKDTEQQRFIYAPVKYGTEVLLSAQTVNMNDKTLQFNLSVDEWGAELIPDCQYEVQVEQDGVAETLVQTLEDWKGLMPEKPEDNKTTVQAVDANAGDTDSAEDVGGDTNDNVDVNDGEIESAAGSETEEESSAGALSQLVYAHIKMKTEEGNYVVPKLSYHAEHYPVTLTLSDDGVGESSQLCEGLATVQWTDASVRKQRYCPECAKPITPDQLKAIFTSSTEEDRKTFADTFNKYMADFGMDNCWNKAHFFAQISVESGMDMKPKAENMNHTVDSLSRFRYFQNNKEDAKKYGRDDSKGQAADKEMIAKLAYGPKGIGGQLGNETDQEGWDYRGRGYIQITGKAAYKDANVYTLKSGHDILADPTLVSSNIGAALIASMAFWQWKNIKRTCIKASQNGRIRKHVCRKVGNDTEVTLAGNVKSTNHAEKIKAFHDISANVIKTGECLMSMGEMCKTCGKDHIDLREIVAYQSQFDLPNPKVACYRACRVILENGGTFASESFKASTLYTIGKEVTSTSSDQSEYVEIDSEIAKQALVYIDQELEAGYPVMVGVDHTKGNTYNDKTVDHFVVIIGRGCEEDGRLYYMFYEVGTAQGTGDSSNNKLYFNTDDCSLRGVPVFNKNKKYVVTTVAKNEKK